jgi:hypothetical protein
MISARAVITHDSQPPPGSDERRQSCKKQGNARQRLGVAREFSREYPEQLVQNGIGENQLIALFDDPPQRFISRTARENDGGNENVGVENDFQPRR